MTHYIDKSALVAEIENRKDSFYSLSESCEKGTPAKAGFYAQAQTLEGILSFLDTLGVKEVDSNDAFIEKACEWLKKNKDNPFIKCEDPCLSGYLTDEFIEDFRKAMEK